MAEVLSLVRSRLPVLSLGVDRPERQTNIRRTTHLLVAERDVVSIDIAAVLRGVVAVDSAPELVTVSILRGEEYSITQDELAVLLAIPTDRWIDIGEAGSPTLIETFADRGLVVSDADEPGLAELRRLDEGLSDAGWDLYGALYHSLGRWKGVLALDGAESLGTEDGRRGGMALDGGAVRAPSSGVPHRR